MAGQVDQMPGCCQAEIVYNFGGVEAFDDPISELPEFDAELSQFAITSGDQAHAVKLLKKTGFKKLKAWKAVETGSMLTLWFRKGQKAKA